MVCNPEIRVLATSLGVTIQGRRRCGRTGGKGSEISNVGEAKAHNRIELEKEYTQGPDPCVCFRNQPGEKNPASPLSL